MIKFKCILFIFLFIQSLTKNKEDIYQESETCNENCLNREKNIEKEVKKNKIDIEDKKILNKKEINNLEKEKIKKEKKLIYEDIFLNQSLLITDNKTSNDESKFFNFTINKKISKYVEKHKVISYPRENFIGKQQGNFLHFFHLVYEQKLPLFFSVDQILYPYIEITKELQRSVMEQGLYNILYQFFNNIIEYGKKEKYEQGILLYFSIALKFLDKNAKVVYDDVCEKLIKNLLNIDKNDINNFYNFTLLNNIRKIDKLNFIQKYPILKGNDNLESISNCIKFLQNFEFRIEKELSTIYRIGHLIYKSGEEKTYREIKKFIKYIFNEEENVMNPLDIYLFINKNYKNETSSNEEINNLYEEIKYKIIKIPTFKFMSNITFNSINEEEEFLKESNNYTSLFSYSFTLDEYINYNLLSSQKFRFYPSYFEYADIAHNGNYMRKTIFDRYKGKNTSSTGKLFKFRDGVDFSKEFNDMRKTIQKSILEEIDKWIDSYENSFNYLLNIIGQSDNSKNKNDESKKKAFNTLIGSYTHFKKDILLFEQHSNFTVCKDGEIIDLYFDPQIKFYEEIYKISIVFQNHLLDLINGLKDKTIKINLEQLIEKKMKRLFISYENILKGIELQENKINDEERKRIKDTMFYYDNKKKQYQGWYVDLYKNQTEHSSFVLNIYIHNFFIAKPISKIDFKGSIIYTAMNYPEFGLICIKDNLSELKKLFIFSSYIGNEYPHGWIDNINFDGLKKLIISRR